MSRFQEELKVIPLTAWIVAVACFLGLAFPLHHLMSIDRNPPPEAVRAALSVFVPIVLAIYILVIGYVNGDARRRRMKHVMWTLLAIFIPNAIGIILYFILRDPMPQYCAHCGGAVNAQFAFCPRCGTALRPACPQCRKAIEPAWTNCAYCGVRL